MRRAVAIAACAASLPAAPARADDASLSASYVRDRAAYVAAAAAAGAAAGSVRRGASAARARRFVRALRKVHRRLGQARGDVRGQSPSTPNGTQAQTELVFGLRQLQKSFGLLSRGVRLALSPNRSAARKAVKLAHAAELHAQLALDHLRAGEGLLGIAPDPRQ